MNTGRQVKKGKENTQKQDLTKEPPQSPEETFANTPFHVKNGNKATYMPVGELQGLIMKSSGKTIKTSEHIKNSAKSSRRKLMRAFNMFQIWKMYTNALVSRIGNMQEIMIELLMDNDIAELHHEELKKKIREMQMAITYLKKGQRIYEVAKRRIGPTSLNHETERELLIKNIEHNMMIQARMAEETTNNLPHHHPPPRRRRHRRRRLP